MHGRGQQSEDSKPSCSNTQRVLVFTSLPVESSYYKSFRGLADKRAPVQDYPGSSIMLLAAEALCTRHAISDWAWTCKV